MDALSLPSAFFRGENSSSLSTSSTTKLLPETEREVEQKVQGPGSRTQMSYLEKGKTSKTNFSILMPLAELGWTRLPHGSTNGTFLMATCGFSWSLNLLRGETEQKFRRSTWTGGDRASSRTVPTQPRPPGSSW